jgi:glycosyltransferase involved in cell wall biosynthesis
MGGMLVPVGDKEELAKAITHLVANEQSRIRLAQNARLRTQDFTQEAVVEKLATFLHTEVVIEK